jgi:hypothetical protein
VRQELARTVLPKSPLGDAIRYLTNQGAALQRYVEDGRLAIDNNRAENQLRVVAVGRKNWLLAGSLEGARRAARLYSLVQSCKLVHVPPFDCPAPRGHTSARTHRRDLPGFFGPIVTGEWPPVEGTGFFGPILE